MLRKKADLEIDSKDPFKHDKLHRKEFAIQLTQLVATLTQPFVISLNSSWGTGKTSFIRMWAEHLRNEGFLCLEYNAWENDFCSEPLISFISELQGAIKSKLSESEQDTNFQNKLDKVKEYGNKISRLTMPLAVKLLTMNLLNSEGIKEIFEIDNKSAGSVADFVSGIAQNKIDDYQNQQKSIEGFRNCLQEFIQTAKKDENIMPVIFFIDEIDRCRPTYAIELLENIKHLFNVEGIVFVIATDMEQLSQSVKALYGLESNPQGYLRRFIDIEVQLPKPHLEAYCNHLYFEFKLDQYFEIVHLTHRDDSRKDFLNTFARLSDIFNLSLRDQAQCFIRFDIVLRLADPNKLFLIELVVFFIALKTHKSTVYNELLDRKITSIEIVDYMQKLPGGLQFFESTNGVEIEAYLHYYFLRPWDLTDLLKKYQDISSGKSAGNMSKSRAEDVWKKISWWREKQFTLEFHEKLVLLQP